MMGCYISAGLGLLVLLFAIRRRHHRAYFMHAYGHGGCGPGGHGGYEGRRGWGVRRGLMRGLFMRLDTTPGQEKAIVKAMESLREQLRGERDELRATRKQVAQAFGGETFDTTVLDSAFSRQGAVLERAKGALSTALQTVHAALDEDQRVELAELLANGGRFFGGMRGLHSC